MKKQSYEPVPMFILGQSIGIPDHYQQCFSPGQCHIKPLRIPQEAQFELYVYGEIFWLTADRRHDDDGSLLTLEFLHRADIDLVKSFLLQTPLYLLNL